MEIPIAFKKLTLGSRQGTLELGVSESELIQDALSPLTLSERASIHIFLNDLLDRDPSGSVIQKIWNQSSASYYIADDEELRSLLRLILQKVQ